MAFDSLEKRYQDNLANLIDQMRKKGCCAFIGAGLSRPADYPLWADLLLTLKREAENYIGEGINDEHLDNYERAEVYREKLGMERYRRVIQHEFDPRNNKQPYLPIHLDIIELPFVSFITTNYDCILENACQKLGIDPIYNHYPLLPITHLRDRQIFHIHGIVDHSRLVETQDSIILTRSDFDEAYSSGSNLIKLISSLYTELTIVFIGFSVGDMFLERIITSSLLDFEKTRKITLYRGLGPIKNIAHFAFLPYTLKPSGDVDLGSRKNSKEIDFETTRSEDERYKSKGIYPIRYEGDSQNHTPLINIIHQLNISVSERKEPLISQDLTFREK